MAGTSQPHGTAARQYHNATKHSVARLHANPHTLDWEIKPLPFKIYPGIAPIPLRRDDQPSTVPALSAVTASGSPMDAGERIPSLAALARILHLSAGITRTKRFPGGEEYAFRAAACTGALYHIDLYVICGDCPGLAAGVYHFGPHSSGLYPLRHGDCRGVLAGATADEPSVAHAPVIIACASTYWRNAWKYQARAYRHCFWDAGTILANLLAVSAAEQLPARIVYGFVDETAATLLGLDTQREGALALVALGRLSAAAHASPPLAPIHPETVPLSPREVDYPAIRAIQAASSLATGAAVATWRQDGLAPPVAAPPSAHSVALRVAAATALPTEPIDHVITRRGSTRAFARAPVAFTQLSTLLRLATTAVPSDLNGSSSELYLIANAVDGLAPGTYVYHPEADTLEQLRAGSFRHEAGFLGLGQELSAEASVDIFFVANLDPQYEHLGNRAYRVAQLDAAIRGGRIYLGAYALHLGATGLTFFDDAVTDFFSPHAAGKSVMFLVAVGHGRRTLPQA